MDPTFDLGSWLDGLWRDGSAPEPALLVSDWADSYRVLPDHSAEPGAWRTSRIPYAREIMDCLSVANPIERVVLQKGGQLGGTEIGLNFIGFCIHHAPGVMMLVMPTLDAVKRNTTARIDPMIAASPVLAELVVEPRAREPGNSQFKKIFPGGQLVMVGCGSGVGLRSTPVRFLMLDEVDAFLGSVGSDGDPVALAIQRTVTFRGRRKIFLCSTPTLKNYSRIEKAYLESDQRRYEVPCPRCGGYAPIEWAQIEWPEGKRPLAHRVCPQCQGTAEEREKPAMLAAGRWVATSEGDGRTAGFHISTLYSPFETWGEIAVEHGQVHKDPPRLQVWTNNKLGETWEDQAGESVEPDSLMARREDWGELLPPAVVLLTAGVDVQKDRIEIQVTGWGRDEESWVVAYVVLWGDPSGPRLWSDLDAYLRTTFPHSRAVPDLTIRAVSVDTGGHYTQAAYEFTRTRLGRRIWGIKGRGGMGVPVWPRRPTKLAKNKGVLFPIGVDAAKDVLFARLKLTEPGPGRIHFSKDRDAEYFRQLTSERVITRYERGRPIRSWHLKREGERNEVLDCTVYGLAALHGLISMGLQLNREAGVLEELPLKTPESSAVRRTPAPRGRRVIASGYM